MVKKTAQGLMLLAALLGSTSGVLARNLFKNAQFDVYGLFGGSTIVDAQYFDSAGRLYHSRYDPDYKFSLGVAIPYNKFLTIESGFTYGPDNLNLTNTNIFPHTVAADRWWSIRWMFTWARSARWSMRPLPSIISSPMRRRGLSTTGSAPRRGPLIPPLIRDGHRPALR